MKKLFSRAVVAMLSLFVGCSSTFALVGQLYVGNENPFSLACTKNNVEEHVIINNNTYEQYACNGENLFYSKGISKYEFFKGSDRKYLITPQKMVTYQFFNRKDIMYRGFSYSAIDKETHERKTFRCDFEPVAKIFRTGECTREVYAISKGGDKFNKFLFKIEYYRAPHESVALRDYEHKKFYTGYYIKRYDGSIAGKVVGKYFPVQAIIYLVLSGELKI